MINTSDLTIIEFSSFIKEGNANSPDLLSQFNWM